MTKPPSSFRRWNLDLHFDRKLDGTETNMLRQTAHRRDACDIRSRWNLDLQRRQAICDGYDTSLTNWETKPDEP